LSGDFQYVVEALAIVDPNNTGALAPTSENVLTMVTCYPFYYVGAAPKRLCTGAPSGTASAGTIGCEMIDGAAGDGCANGE